MRRTLLVAALAIAFVLAGCLDATGGSKSGSRSKLAGRGIDVSTLPVIQPGWSEAALVAGGEHDHTNHAVHAGLSTANFQVFGWNPLITDYHGRTAGGYLCGDANEKNGRRLSVVHSFTSDVAFIISDVTDPTDPKKIGELAMPTTHVYDLALTPDQQYVLLATSPLGLLDNVLGALPPYEDGTWGTFRDACTGEERPVKGPEAGLPFASGIVLVDISNPRAPNIIDFRMFPVLGGHSVHVREMNGRPLILATIANLPGQTSFYVFMEIQATPAGGKLNVLSVYQWRPNDPQQYAQMATHTNHDGYLQKHPVTGQNLAYLAYGNDGLIILNVDDPRIPRFLGAWMDWNAVGGYDGSHYFHEALPIEGTWDGRHYTFTGEECGSHPTKSPTCLAYAFDTTDPAKPTMAGVWTLPNDVPWSGGLQFSLHYLGLVNQTLFVTVYHGGLWAVDVSHLDATAPQNLKSVGVFLPPNVSPKPAPGRPYSPRVNDLNTFDDGTMVVYDAWTGLYMVRFDDANLAPPPEPWAVFKR